MNQISFEDMVYSVVEGCLKDTVLTEIKKKQKEIKRLIEEQLNEEYLKDTVKDFITYDEALGDFIRGVAVEHLQGKIGEIFK